MSTQISKWLLAGVMAVSMTMTHQRAHAHGDAEAIVTGLAIGAVAATLVRDDDGHRHHHRHESYREVHNYYDRPNRRYCPPRVRVENHYHGNRGGHYGGYGHRGDYYDDNRREFNRGRSVIVNHY